MRRKQLQNKLSSIIKAIKLRDEEEGRQNKFEIANLIYKSPLSIKIREHWE